MISYCHEHDLHWDRDEHEMCPLCDRRPIDDNRMMAMAIDLREAFDVLAYRVSEGDTGVSDTFYGRWRALYDQMVRMRSEVADVSTLPPPVSEAVERYTPIYI